MLPSDLIHAEASWLFLKARMQSNKYSQIILYPQKEKQRKLLC